MFSTTKSRLAAIAALLMLITGTAGCDALDKTQATADQAVATYGARSGELFHLQIATVTTTCQDNGDAVVTVNVWTHDGSRIHDTGRPDVQSEITFKSPSTTKVYRKDLIAKDTYDIYQYGVNPDDTGAQTSQTFTLHNDKYVDVTVKNNGLVLSLIVYKFDTTLKKRVTNTCKTKGKPEPPAISPGACGVWGGKSVDGFVQGQIERVANGDGVVTGFTVWFKNTDPKNSHAVRQGYWNGKGGYNANANTKTLAPGEEWSYKVGPSAIDPDSNPPAPRSTIIQLAEAEGGNVPFVGGEYAGTCKQD